MAPGQTLAGIADDVAIPALIDYIDQHRQEFGVEPICRALTEAGAKIAPSRPDAVIPPPLAAVPN